MIHRLPISLFVATAATALVLAAGASCREEVDSPADSPAPFPAVPNEFEGTTYVMEMRGMVCGGCMMEVKDALAKAADVPDEAVEFKRGSRPETKKVVFTAKSATLTEAQIKEALGEAAERLVIENFAVEEKS